MAKKFFRVAVEGATIDGRTIKREWLTQAAANYDASVYGARVWVEHLRSAWADSPFSAQGDVVELKAEVIKGGKLDGKMALYAVIDPLADLVKLNKAGKKVYSSIEIDPKFADTGEAYVTGLAVTDEPASLGTELLKFRANADKKKFTTEYIEIDLDGLDDDDDDEQDDDSRSARRSDKSEGVLSKMLSKFRRMSGRQDKADQFTAQTVELLEEMGDAIDDVGQRVQELEKRKFAKLKKDHDTLREDFNALKEQLSKQDGGRFKRKEATGEDNSEGLADC